MPRGLHWLILGGATPDINVRLYADIVSALQAHRTNASFVVLSYARLIHKSLEEQLTHDEKTILDTLQTCNVLARSRSQVFHVILSSYSIPNFSLLTRVQDHFGTFENLKVCFKPSLVIEHLMRHEADLNVGVLCNHFELRTQIYHDLLINHGLKHTALDEKQTDYLLQIYGNVYARDPDRDLAAEKLDVLLWQLKNQGVNTLILDQNLESLVNSGHGFRIVTPARVIAATMSV